MLRAALVSLTALSSGLLFAPTAAVAQVGQASLRGTITAPADNPVVEVTAIEISTGLRRTVPADARGAYNFASLRAGTYRLEIKQRNGTRNSDALTLRVGQVAGLDLDLSAPTPTAAQGTAAQGTAAVGANSRPLDSAVSETSAARNIILVIGIPLFPI
ncbi:MAG: carboxypeptidase regulatory-like domain-containing protein, partial [Sphingomonas sp.]